MHAFICNECKYGVALTSGVLLVCPNCEEFCTLRRATHEEYHKCETNDGNIKEEPIEADLPYGAIYDIEDDSEPYRGDI